MIPAPAAAGPGASAATNADADAAADLRRPQQERGERRVKEILDAAAGLISEVGIEGLTVQTLGERAKTSRGSLYHFFPEIGAVLRALLARHHAAIDALVAAAGADAAVDWRALSVEETVDRFMSPLLSYLETHPDLLVLARAPSLVERGPERYAPMISLADGVLRARLPALPDEARAARAATLVAVLTGVLGFGMRASTVPHAALVRELRRVLASYLRAVEADAAPPADPLPAG